MRLRTLYLVNNNCYKSHKPLKPKGIMIHSTGANNPNLRRYVGPDDGLLGHNPNNNHWNQPRPDSQQKCVHAFIGLLKDGTVATYQTLPWHWRGWHCGGSGNNTHIGFEICEGKLDDGAYFAKVYREAVELTAYLCKLYKLDPLADGVVICHSEGHARGIAGNHADVMHWFPRHGKNMDTFRNDVAALMKEEKDLNKAETEQVVKDVIQEKNPFYVNLEDIPTWGRATVQKLLDKKAIEGTGTGLNLSYETLRLLVINDRMGVYST